MKKKFLVLAALLLCLAPFEGLQPWGTAPAEAANISSAFIDMNFRAVVLAALGKGATDSIYDTDNFASVTQLDASSKNIMTLAGLQYFTALENLLCGFNQITSLPALPSSLTGLYCEHNQLTSLPTLTAGLNRLFCANNQLTSLPTLPLGLKDLNCAGNQLTSLPSLPSGLMYLECSGNYLASLPVLPSSLAELVCPGNMLTSLPALPANLTTLDCLINQLTSLPTLPPGLNQLNCCFNRLTSLPVLPNSLEDLNCSYNMLALLPALPNSLKELDCSANRLSSLPTLPTGLTLLHCSNNQLTSLPSLSAYVVDLDCHNNRLTALNVTGLTLVYLNCAYNYMTNETMVTGFPVSSWDETDFIFDPQLTPGFIAATDIIELPYTTEVGKPLTLTGTVFPSNTTNKTISWSVSPFDTGETLPGVSGNTFTATRSGIALSRATIANGLGAGSDFTFDFVVRVLAVPMAAPSIAWQKCLGGAYEDGARSIHQTSDGGYIVAGYIDAASGDAIVNDGAWVVKLNANGVIEREKRLGDIGMNRANSIQQTDDGGYIVAGEGVWVGFCVIKLDVNLVIEWQKSLGGTGVHQAKSIQQTSDGGYIVAGLTESNDGDVSGDHGRSDVWVVKLAPAARTR